MHDPLINWVETGLQHAEHDSWAQMTVWRMHSILALAKLNLLAFLSCSSAGRARVHVVHGRQRPVRTCEATTTTTLAAARASARRVGSWRITGASMEDTVSHRVWSTTLRRPTMDISALVNHDTEAAVLPRRSLSRPSSVSASSPMAVTTRIPHAPQPTPQQMPRKRRRHDPKPIWAYREGEELPPELQQQQRQQRQQSRPPPAPAQPPPTPAQAQPRVQSSPIAHRNGPPSSAHEGAPTPHSATAVELVGFERPISDSPHVYDDVSRQVCEFLWREAIGNEVVRSAITDPHVKLEVEARWGQVIDKHSNQRLRGAWDSECVLRTGALDVKFESTMTLEQHKKMNLYLNEQIQRSKVPGATRAAINYQHTREIDAFYELGQEEFQTLHPLVQRMIHAHSMTGGKSRIRVTRKKDTGEVKDAIIKHRLGNMEISSPRTEWDYRIGVNLEIDYLGAVEHLKPSVEPGKTPESMQRQKDRISYAWLDAYQVDLTQVAQGVSKNHELELELDSMTLLRHADKVRRKEPNQFEGLINGLMNNLRVLSREMTAPASGA